MERFLTTTIKDTDILVVDAEVTNVFIDMNTGKVVPVDNEIISFWPDLGKYFKNILKKQIIIQ